MVLSGSCSKYAEEEFSRKHQLVRLGGAVGGRGRGRGRYHLLDTVEALPVEAEGLFKQNLVLHRPLIWKRCEVGEISQRLVDVVFVPEEHPQSLRTKRQEGQKDTRVSPRTRSLKSRDRETFQVSSSSEEGKGKEHLFIVTFFF